MEKREGGGEVRKLLGKLGEEGGRPKLLPPKIRSVGCRTFWNVWGLDGGDNHQTISLALPLAVTDKAITAASPITFFWSVQPRPG